MTAFMLLEIKMDSTFNIWISPEQSTYDNSKFSVQLPNPLFFDENWKVGLNSISLPSKISCLSNEEHSLVLILSEQTSNEDVKLPKYDYHYFKLKDVYYSGDSLINYLNEELKEHSVSLHVNNEKKIVIKALREGKLLATHVLGSVLGMFDYDNEPEVKEFKFTAQENDIFPHNFNPDYIKPAYYLVYTDIIKPSIMCSKYTNILKYIPIKNVKEKNIPNHSFNVKNIDFCDISAFMIKEVTIEIRTHSGALPVFENNEIILNLQFSCLK